MYLYNSPEYCETNFAALKIRGVPINVNYRYLDNELEYLLDNADVEALVFHTLARRSGRARCATGCPSSDCSSRSTTVPPLTAPRTSKAPSPYEELQATAEPAARMEPRGRRRVHASTRAARRGCQRASCTRSRDFTEFFLQSLPADDRAGARSRTRRTSPPRPGACTRPARRSSPCPGRP